jgi:hypothetical protein
MSLRMPKPSAFSAPVVFKMASSKAHIQSAKVYEEVHPRRGRPRRLAEVNPQLVRRVTRVVKRAAAA